MNEIKVSPIITQVMLNHFIQYEGKVNHFYLDGPGYVTIGIGCLIPDANAATYLNLFHKKGNLVATNPEKVIEYKAIKNSLPGKTASYYDTVCLLYLPDTDIIKLFEFRIVKLIEMLRPQFKEYNTLPEEVRNIILDMAYNLGITGLLTKFPRFIEAIKQNDWARAAVNSHRKGIQESRNQWVRDTLLNLNESPSV